LELSSCSTWVYGELLLQHSALVNQDRIWLHESKAFVTTSSLPNVHIITECFDRLSTCLQACLPLPLLFLHRFRELDQSKSSTLIAVGDIAGSDSPSLVRSKQQLPLHTHLQTIKLLDKRSCRRR
jgi:hypothetical protein